MWVDGQLFNRQTTRWLSQRMQDHKRIHQLLWNQIHSSEIDLRQMWIWMLIIEFISGANVAVIILLIVLESL